MASIALLSAAPVAAAEPAAVDEYVLTLPGVQQSDVQPPSAIEVSADQIGKVGVVGEQTDDFTKIGAVSAAAASPGGVLALALVAGGIALALVRRRERS